jgi:glucose uptake protein GlcU
MPKVRVALVILGDIMLTATVVLLLEINKLVNGSLYDYGLIFSDDWSDPYRLMFGVCLVLIVVAIVLISVLELPHPAFQDET